MVSQHIIGTGAREQFGLGVGENVGLAGDGLDARLFLEVVQDALLHRDRQADGAEFLFGEAGGECLLCAPGRERHAGRHRHAACSSLQEPAPGKMVVTHCSLLLVYVVFNLSSRRSLPRQ